MRAESQGWREDGVVNIGVGKNGVVNTGFGEHGVLTPVAIGSRDRLRGRSSTSHCRGEGVHVREYCYKG